MKQLYDILFDLECTRDGDTDGEYYGVKAVFGEHLDRLIRELQEIREHERGSEDKLKAVTLERDKLQKELDAHKEAFKLQSAEIKTRDGATRAASIGQVVLFKSAKWGGAWVTALIQEVYGFPPGKVGLRVLGRTPQQDSFEYAQYDTEGYHVGPCWKWLDE